MKKIFIVLTLVLLSFLLIFGVKLAFGEVSLYSDYQEGRVSEVYVKFTQEFGRQFGLRMKECKFLGEYRVRILEGVAKIRYQDEIKEELVIGVFINKEKRPFPWIRTEDLNSEEKIREKAEEFSNKIFEKLKELEKKRNIRTPKILV